MRTPILLFPLLLSVLLFCLLVPPAASTKDERRFRPTLITPEGRSQFFSPWSGQAGPDDLDYLAHSAHPSFSHRLSASESVEPLPVQAGINVCNGANCLVNFDDVPGNFDIRNRYQQIKFSSSSGGSVIATQNRDGALAVSLPNSIIPAAGGRNDLYVDFTQPVT